MGRRTISRVRYGRGLIRDASHRRRVRHHELRGSDIPREVIATIEREDLASIEGIFGSPAAGDPIQYDHLEIEDDRGSREITVYNRAILLFTTGDEVVKRIHRVCCVLDEFMPDPDRPAADAAGGPTIRARGDRARSRAAAAATRRSREPSPRPVTARRPHRSREKGPPPERRTCAFCGSEIPEDQEVFGFGAKALPGVDLGPLRGTMTEMGLPELGRKVPVMVAGRDSDAAREGFDLCFMTCSEFCAKRLKAAIDREIESGGRTLD